MTVTYNVIHKTVEGNLRANYGFTTYASGDSTAYINTGLREAKFFSIDSLNSGSVVMTHPLEYPNIVDGSGYVTVVFHSNASGAMLWRAVGRV